MNKFYLFSVMWLIIDNPVKSQKGCHCERREAISHTITGYIH